VNQIYATAQPSRRETEVLWLFGDGKTTAEIAEELKLGVKTVQQYCARLKQKLHAANTHQLIRIAVLWRAGTEIVVKEAQESVGRKQMASVSAYKSRAHRTIRRYTKP
jgi:DNA-binding CsgD family transcriptional regulator